MEMSFGQMGINFILQKIIVVLSHGVWLRENVLKVLYYDILGGG